MENVVTIANAFKYRARHLVLENISLNIPEGSIVGLAGPSGGGKTTLLRCIQGLDNLDQGSLTVTGSSGFMFQDFQLFPHLTVLENVLYATKFNSLKTNYYDKALSLLNSLGISEKKDVLPRNLSGGQKQRTALARLLILEPDLLLFDEPTSGLDIATIDEVVRLLSKVRGFAKVMVIASHDLDFLAKIANRVLLLKDGKILVDMQVEKSLNLVEELRSFYN